MIMEDASREAADEQTYRILLPAMVVNSPIQNEPHDDRSAQLGMIKR